MTGLLAGPLLTEIHSAETYTVYVGTYTGGDSKGIYAFEMDRESGKTTHPRLIAETENPSFLALHPSQKFLYAVNETGEFKGSPGGGISAFLIREDQLHPLNWKPTRGGAPCHLHFDREGRSVLVANYSGGSVISYHVDADGRLGALGSFIQHTGSSVNPARQSAPHAHGIYLTKDNRHALVPDLGLDQVLVYDFDTATARLTPAEVPFATVAPGSGPRHLAFHPSGKHVYVLNEILATITTFAFDSETGTLQNLATVTTLPDGLQKGFSTAEIFVHPNGRFVFSSNRGHDSIAIFAVDPTSGNLRPIGHQSTGGKTPRNFNLDPAGEWLLAANQNSGNISMFRVDATTGGLTPADNQIAVPRPVCIVFADGK